MSAWRRVISWLQAAALGVSFGIGLDTNVLRTEISTLLKSTGSNFEHHYHVIRRAEPLVPIGLTDVEQWMASGKAVKMDDVELFPRPDQKGQPRTVPVAGRLAKVRSAFGNGQALVINSLHRWCPKGMALATELKAQVGLPVDVYMYLTPPYSKSYGLHADVMDAFMVQLVGSKHWTACERDGSNCTDTTLVKGDVLYLPMGSQHKAWTTDELSAHLTVNIERQFYVWGSIAQALADRLASISEAGRGLDTLRNMQPYGMEGETDLARLLEQSALRLPKIMVQPSAVAVRFEQSKTLSGAALAEEWQSVLSDILSLQLRQPVVLLNGRRFQTADALFKMLEATSEADTQSALDWVARTIESGIRDQHEAAMRGSKMPKLKDQGPEQLGALAAARVSTLDKNIKRPRTEI